MTVAALLISLLALGFTVTSFWWLHARRGTLLAYEPSVWSGTLSSPTRSVMRWPVLLHNPGAAAIVVTSMRLRFDDGDEALDWEWTYDSVKPVEGETYDVAAPFSVSGRSTRRLVACFNGPLPGVVPEPRPYRAHLEVTQGHAPAWASLLTFDVHFENLNAPTRYLARANLPDYLEVAQRDEVAQELDELRTQWSASS